MALIDTHLHLESCVQQKTLEATLTRAREAGVEAMIAIGTSPEDWTLYRDLAHAHPGFIYNAVGLHPCSVTETWEQDLASMPAFWDETGRSPVALGECGLDRFHLPKDPAAAEQVFAWQQAAFVAQLALAKRLGCPLVVHSRGAFAECVALIDASGVDWKNVVFHCFVEGETEMRQLKERGGFGSFTGVLTYKNAETVRQALKEQGLDRLMLETDAPYLTPVPHRGKPNEPAYVRYIAEYAATLFDVSYETLAATTTTNARRFFRL